MKSTQIKALTMQKGRRTQWCNMFRDKRHTFIIVRFFKLLIFCRHIALCDCHYEFIIRRKKHYELIKIWSLCGCDHFWVSNIAQTVANGFELCIKVTQYRVPPTGSRPPIWLDFDLMCVWGRLKIFLYSNSHFSACVV